MFKYCHSCGAEFQPTASVCPDCNEPLHSAPARADESGAPAGPIAPIEDLVLLKVGEPWELRELAEVLQARGISSQIDAYPLGGKISGGSRVQAARLGIYVTRADIDAVRALAAELAENELSGSDEDDSYDPTVCPACGEPTPENAAACASCGLEFPEIEAER